MRDEEAMRQVWREIRNEAQSRWERLTDEDLDLIAGEWDRLVETLRSRYDYDEQRAEEEVNDFYRAMIE